ncbi:Fc.00g021180.m01.CDS01 [Cosmosporella sp. VM-42]
MSDLPVLPFTAAGLGVVCLSALPAIFAILTQLRDRTPRDNFYSDIDGKSTPETIAAFSTRLPKSLVLLLSTIGLGTSIAISVLSTLQHSQHGFFLENWLSTASWGFILVHAISLAAHHSPVRSHDLGLWLLLSSVVTTALTFLQLAKVVQQVANRNDPETILRAINVITAIALGFASVLLPRRPEVLFNDRKVDGQWTVSALSRYTWAWPRPLLDQATKKNDLDAADVPEPDHTIRAERLTHEWEKINYQGSLLSAILWTYKIRLAIPWTATIVRCFLSLMPYLAMLRLIKILEGEGREGNTLELWALVVCLGLFTLVDQWIEGWVFWYALADMAMPLRAQLSALIFEKSLRRKNIKAAEQVQESTEPGNDGDKKKDKAEDGESEDASVLKSRQAIVNLVGVDATRISNFAAYQFMIVNGIFKLTFYSVFLVQLIGWIPFTAGILAWGITLPVNTYFAKLLMKCSKRLMGVRDEKLAVVNEALLGIRQIKFSALEAQWEKRILAMREKELKTIWQLFLADTVLFACWVISPILLAATSLTVYALVNKQLLPSVAFVSIGIFKGLEMTLTILPEIIAMGVDTLVSVKRIDTYLKSPEMEKILSEGPVVSFDDASISWPVDEKTADEDRFILRNLNFSFPTGELSVISGKTGTGKSLLISAILGEVDLLEGSIRVPHVVHPSERHDSEAHPGNWILKGSVAYVGQSPWLESASFRDNVLFGLPFIEDRYNKVIEVCALKKDLEILTDGDKTELGANGINLSGGQKWRVTLARAVYSRAEILVMDDVFSAVDAHVGRQIFEKCVAGDICKGRTRILITHHVALVQPKTKFLVDLGEGTVLHTGLISDLSRNGILEEIKSHEQTEQEILDEEAADASTAVNSSQASVTDGAETEEINALQKMPSKDAKQFIQDEIRQKGVVKSHVYATYLKDSGGWKLWGICALVFTAYEAGTLGRAWWLRVWTGPQETAATVSIHEEHGYASAFSLQQPLHTTSGLNVSQTQHDLTYYLWVYIAISVATGLVGTMRFFWSFTLAMKASRALFNKILFTVLRTPLRWLDTVPIGRILNRFTSDFNTIDSRITIDYSMLFANVLGLIGVCVAAVFASTLVIPLAAVLLFVALIIGKKYMDGARPLKRLESNSKSPVFEIFNAALAGLPTIRGYHKTQVYIDRMYHNLDKWDMISTYMWLLNRWMGFRMSLLGTVFTTVVGMVIILSPSMDAALAGFTLSFALEFSMNVLWTIRHYANMELNMNCAERVVEYTELKTESQDGEKPPAAWPTSGSMEVDNLVVSYADDLPPVLKGISFNVNDNERVGVVGRTGAGKSSLTLALFRFLEARSGSVRIDGLDISKIDLHSLRSRLAIIPQDPVLFSGTIRSNLDPFDDRTDEELRDSLSRVHLIDSLPPTPANEPASAATSTLAPRNTNIFQDLTSPISESGGNLSQGQRQLLCLARAIVARPKIMVLDEATSAVDMTTDALIQRSIREEFTDSTLVVIAHRLSTIADFDRILVLSDGEVAEFGTPRELWEMEDGVFRGMCEHSGEKEKLKQTIFGQKLR